jgi:hypothetical protein
MTPTSRTSSPRSTVASPPGATVTRWLCCACCVLCGDEERPPLPHRLEAVVVVLPPPPPREGPADDVYVTWRLCDVTHARSHSRTHARTHPVWRRGLCDDGCATWLGPAVRSLLPRKQTGWKQSVPRAGAAARTTGAVRFVSGTWRKLRMHGSVSMLSCCHSLPRRRRRQQQQQQQQTQ